MRSYVTGGVLMVRAITLTRVIRRSASFRAGRFTSVLRVILVAATASWSTVWVPSVCLIPAMRLGVFDGSICVGAAVYDGTEPFGLTAWRDDNQTGVLDGYVPRS